MLVHYRKLHAAGKLGKRLGWWERGLWFEMPVRFKAFYEPTFILTCNPAHTEQLVPSSPFPSLEKSPALIYEIEIALDSNS